MLSCAGLLLPGAFLPTGAARAAEVIGGAETVSNRVVGELPGAKRVLAPDSDVHRNELIRTEAEAAAGYAEAVTGGKRAGRAREGLGTILSTALQAPDFQHDWSEIAARYRMFLFEEGREVTGDPGRGESSRPGMTEAEVEAVATQGGRMSLAEALRHRVRYFCDGAVLGSAEFVEAVFEREQSLRGRFGEKRRTGARPMRGADWGGLRVLRDLQKEVMGSAGPRREVP